MIQDIVAQLKDKKGYTQYPQGKYHPWDYVTLLQKELKTDIVCELSDKIYITLYVYQIKDQYDSFTIELAIEKDDLYYKCSCRLSMCDVVEKIDKSEKLLIKMIELI